MPIKIGRPSLEDIAAAERWWDDPAERAAYKPPRRFRDPRRRRGYTSSGYRGSWMFDLPPDVYGEMVDEALRLGLSISKIAQLAWKLARDVIRTYPAAIEPPRPKKKRRKPSRGMAEKAERGALMRQADADEAEVRRILAALPKPPPLPGTGQLRQRGQQPAAAASPAPASFPERVVRALRAAGQPLDLNELQHATGIETRHSLRAAVQRAVRARKVVRVGLGAYALPGAAAPAEPPRRYRMLALLHARGECSVAELAAALGQKRRVFRRHVKHAMAAGFVERLDEGRYVLTPAGETYVEKILDGVLVGRVHVPRKERDDEREGTPAG